MDTDSEIIHGNGTDISAFTHEWSGIELLHEGRYFLVYRAMRMGRWFVLKCVRHDREDDVMHRTLLEKEFGIGYHLQHPNIVRTLGMEKVDGLGTCIVLDFIDGMTLRQCIGQNTLAADKCVTIIEELLSALAYLYDRQIVHRDIKPENIMITSDGSHALLIDFGLADSASYAMLKGAAGTHRYAAPECEDGICDSLSDIYSFGRVIEEMNQSLNLNNSRLRRISRECQTEERGRRPQTAGEIIGMLNGKRKFPYRYILLSVMVMVAVVAGVVFYNSYRTGTVKVKEKAPAVQKTVVPKDSAVGENATGKTDKGNGGISEKDVPEIRENKVTATGVPQEKKAEKDKYALLISRLNTSIRAVYRKHYRALTDTSLTWHGKMTAIQSWGFENDDTVNHIVASFSVGKDTYEKVVIKAKADSVKKSLWKKQEKALPQYVIDHDEKMGIYRKYNKGTASGTKWLKTSED